jgi:hypothetical protein
LALDTYTNLQTAVLTWLARPSDTLISGSIPDMITLFETEANLRLRTYFQESSYTFQTVAAISATTNSTTAAGAARICSGVSFATLTARLGSPSAEGLFNFCHYMAGQPTSLTFLRFIRLAGQPRLCRWGCAFDPVNPTPLSLKIFTVPMPVLRAVCEAHLHKVTLLYQQ